VFVILTILQKKVIKPFDIKNEVYENFVVIKALYVCLVEADGIHQILL
jgi:hypothetical protein